MLLMAQIDNDFPAGLRVQHIDTKKKGTITDFGGLSVHFDPWEVPVKWDGDSHTCGVNYENLRKT